MQGALKYIDVKFPKVVFDELKYATGTGAIQLDFGNEGCKGILLHYLYFVTNTSRLAITFLDQYGVSIFSTLDFFGLTWYPIPLVREGTVLKISCSDPTIKFTVSYQKLFGPTTKK